MNRIPDEYGGVRRVEDSAQVLRVRDGANPETVLSSVTLTGDLPVFHLVSSPNRRLIAGTGNAIVLIDPQHPEWGPVYLHGHTSPVNDVVFRADGKVLFTTGDDGTVRRWALPADGLIPPPSAGSAH